MMMMMAGEEGGANCLTQERLEFPTFESSKGARISKGP
jgi:hypothetical protein